MARRSGDPAGSASRSNSAPQICSASAEGVAPSSPSRIKTTRASSVAAGDAGGRIAVGRDLARRRLHQPRHLRRVDLRQQRRQRRHHQRPARLVAEVVEREPPSADPRLELTVGPGDRREGELLLHAQAPLAGTRRPLQAPQPRRRFFQMPRQRHVEAGHRLRVERLRRDQRLERRARDGVAGGHLVLGHLAEDVGAVAGLGEVALPLGQRLHHLAHGRRSPRLAHQIHRVGADPDHQRSLEAGDVVEEPGAAGVHEQRRPLQLQEVPHPLARRLAPGGQRRPPERLQRPVAHRDRIVDHRAVGVARPPRVEQQLAGGIFIEARRRVADQIEPAAKRARARPGSSRGRPPCCIRSRGDQRPTPCAAAPGGPFAVGAGGEARLPDRRVARQVGAEVRHLDPAPDRLDARREGQRQIGELLVMPPELAVRGAQDQPLPGRLRALGRGARGVEQALGAAGGLAEGDRARHLAVEHRQRDASPRAVGVAPQVGAPGVEAVAIDVGPFVVARGPHAVDLLGRQDRVRDPELDERGQRGGRDARLGEPQAVGRAAEPSLEVLQAPEQLGPPVGGIAQGNDRVRIGLGDGAARSQPLPLLAVGGPQPGRHRRILPGDPARQRGADVERQPFVVVDDRLDPPVGGVDARERVGPIALGVDALVPVVERRRRGLARDVVGPGVLARWLVEVPVDHQRDWRVGRRGRRRLRRHVRSFAIG